jgi:hypothetical protein
MHVFNLAAGKIIPLIILGGLAYSIYAVTYEIAGMTLYELLYAYAFPP